MLRGIESAATAMRMQSDREDVISRNIENLRVPGYKQETTSVSGFVAALNRAETGNQGTRFAALSTSTPVGGVGLDTGIDGVSVDFSQGTFQQTNRGLDVALNGDGFLKVRNADGDFYSRGGALHVDGMGRLTTSAGNFVLDTNGAQITVPDSSSVAIASDGTITSAGKAVAKLDVEEFAPGTLMTKVGDLLYAPDDPTVTSSPATATVVKGGYLEQSNVDDVAAMTEMTGAMRIYQANQQMLLAQDQLLGKAIDEVGTVTA